MLNGHKNNFVNYKLIAQEVNSTRTWYQKEKREEEKFLDDAQPCLILCPRKQV